MACVALLYTHLNLEERFFVSRLGCGCQTGFNTNWLTLGLGGILIQLANVIAWLAFRPTSKRVRIAVLLGNAALGLVLLRDFLRWNWWL